MLRGFTVRQNPILLLRGLKQSKQPGEESGFGKEEFVLVDLEGFGDGFVDFILDCDVNAEIIGGDQCSP